MSDLIWLATPLFTNAGGGAVFVGVDSSRCWWIRAVANGVPVREVTASDSSGAMMLLPLMQPGYGGAFRDVVAHLEQMLDAASLSRDLIASFPFYGPVLLAYREMPRWTEWAKSWIGDVPLEDDEVFALSDLLQSSAIPQDARHAALRRIHAWERTHGVSVVRRRDT